MIMISLHIFVRIIKMKGLAETSLGGDFILKNYLALFDKG